MSPRIPRPEQHEILYRVLPEVGYVLGHKLDDRCHDVHLNIPTINLIMAITIIVEMPACKIKSIIESEL